MGRSKKIIVTLTFGIGLALFCTASTPPEDPTAPPEVVLATSVTPALSEPVKETPNGDAQVKDPGVLETYGPPGTIISIILGGLGLIVKTWKEARQIDVDGAKARATEAEARMNEEVGKAQLRVQEAEKERDDAEKDADRLRAELILHKNDFLERQYNRIQDHRREIDTLATQHEKAEKRMHSAYIMELSTRRKREELLAENGISFENCPPPYTPEVAKSVTVGDIIEAQESLNTSDLPIIDTEE